MPSPARRLHQQLWVRAAALAAVALLSAIPALGAAFHSRPVAAASPIASMTIARSGHTATLLPDGRIIVAGGHTSITTAELYDPSSNEWSAAGNLSIARIGHTATLLQNGQILALGGTSPYNAQRAELYDPAAGRWRVDGTLPTARTSHTATLLGTGSVLVAGGAVDSSTTADLYAPGGTWSATGNMSTVRFGHTATLLPSGRVLVAGGSMLAKQAEVYDPSSGEWSATGPMKYARAGHTATLLPDGRVLVVGGYDSLYGPYPPPYDTGTQIGNELYDPATKTWLAAAGMSMRRWKHTATLLPDGRVIVMGGYSGYNQPQSSVEIYDPAAGRWYAAQPLREARANHTATLLPDGTIVVIGGDGIAGLLASAERYDPRAATLGVQRFLPWASSERPTPYAYPPPFPPYPTATAEF